MSREAEYLAGEPHLRPEQVNPFELAWVALRDDKRSVLLMGAGGRGKTWIAERLYSRARFYGTDCKWLYTPEWFMDIRDSFRADAGEASSEREFVRSACGARLLVLDDLGAERATEYVESILGMVIHKRLSSRGLTVLTTNLTLSEIGRTYGGRVHSRLQEYVHLIIGGEDIRGEWRKSR